jgi:hypothetical protein
MMPCRPTGGSGGAASEGDEVKRARRRPTVVCTSRLASRHSDCHIGATRAD